MFVVCKNEYNKKLATKERELKEKVEEINDLKRRVAVAGIAASSTALITVPVPLAMSPESRVSHGL